MKIIARTSGVILVAVAALAIPARPVAVPDSPSQAAGGFVWARDSLWLALEKEFVALRGRDCIEMEAPATAWIAELEGIVSRLAGSGAPSADPLLDSLETGIFRLGPTVAACPRLLDSYTALYVDLRRVVKSLSIGWDLKSPQTRDRLYRLLYGGRAAVEEATLQHPANRVALVAGIDEPSATPSALVQGLRVHSGDILVSRGGYPTSALISRGSDYPGNFSHVALLHVDEESGEASTIESHIEIGVAVASAEEYLEDKKLRILVLRPRADLPLVLKDPLLPHRAAEAARTRAVTGHVPYDFEMDYADPSRLFCSEVASSAYSGQGVTLWMGISRISNPGLRRWLASFGVRHFETQEPSDLEYDPQLVVVAEWRDPETLFKDHVDNAVTDAMLEGAERGDALDYHWYQLPAARLMKGYSWLRERFGGVGPIPEGMSAAAALRNRSYTERHGRLAKEVQKRAAEFGRTNGYVAPYWQLLEMARAEVASEDLVR